jgi:tetratricopeptide (TPR) repeat protein
MLGYYLAGEFVHFYVGKHGMDALVFALDLIAWGMGTEEAMVEASGGTERELNQAYHAYLDEQCAMLGNLPDPPRVDDESMEQIATETQMWMQLPSPFTNALKAGNEAAAEERWADAETAFAKAHELFPDYSAENAPLRERARIQEMQEKREELKETLRQIIEWDSASYAEGRQLAQLLREDGATTGALEAAWYAFDINPFDLENLSDLFAAQRAAEQKPEAIGTIQKLIYADKANRVDHRFDLAQLLAEAGDRDSAMWETVTLLETMPHYWEAQKLLLTLVGEEEEETP